MRVWRKKQKWQVIAALLFAVWILMETRKINVNAENMEAESFTGETDSRNRERDNGENGNSRYWLSCSFR